jgi:hypothetical protein
MKMRVLIIVAAMLAVTVIGPRATADEKAKSSPDERYHPREVAAGQFEKWTAEAAKNPVAAVRRAYTRVEYDGKTFWVADAHYGDRGPYKEIAMYAPEKDGSFRRILASDSIQAESLAVTVDPKSGMLELRERANGELKGQVVLSFNLKTVGASN